jgi:hypothetical protein
LGEFFGRGLWKGFWERFSGTLEKVSREGIGAFERISGRDYRDLEKGLAPLPKDP